MEAMLFTNGFGAVLVLAVTLYTGRGAVENKHSTDFVSTN
jgi:hypothetical protein